MINIELFVTYRGEKLFFGDVSSNFFDNLIYSTVFVGGDNLKGVGGRSFCDVGNFKKVVLFENVKGYIVTRGSKGINSAKQICDFLSGSVNV